MQVAAVVLPTGRDGRLCSLHHVNACLHLIFCRHSSWRMTSDPPPEVLTWHTRRNRYGRHYKLVGVGFQNHDLSGQ